MLRRFSIALLIAAGLASCGDDDPLPEDRYEGPIAACEVEVPDGPSSGDFEVARASAAPEYWKKGPYGVWNTSPGKACPGDPVMEQVGDQRNVALYVTYPAASVPTKTGSGAVAPGKWPVIVFAHANSDRECNIYRRYFSLHDHWASWGFVVAAVDGTYTNCRPGNKENIEKRIEGQLEAIAKLRELNEDPDSRFYGHIDLDTVVFAGHSRGGGASLIAAERYGDAKGVINIQGIDVTAFGFGAQTLPDYPVVGFTAGEDVDLNYPIVEPTEDQLGGPYTWVNINGGIHAYTADTAPIEPDDEPLIERKQQHDITEYYSTAFLARWVGVGDGNAPTTFEPNPDVGELLFTHEAAQVVDEHISELGVFQRWRSDAPATWIDRFGGTSPSENMTGGQNTSTGLDRSAEVPTYRPDHSSPGAVYGKAISRLLEAEGTGTFRLELDGVTAPPAGSLQARIKGPDEGAPADFTVTVELADGTTLEYPGAGGDIRGKFIGPEPLSNRFTQLVIPGDDFAGNDFAGEGLAAVEFEVSEGAIFVDDLRLVEE